MMKVKKLGRLAPQTEQETKSIGQLISELARWQPNELKRDLGEDVLVQVHNEEGRWVGLSALIQVKSVQDVKGVTLHAGAVVSYPFSRAHLEQWEDVNPPVVLVVWDVASRQGVWLDVPSAISNLDLRERKSWRRQTTVNVHIPTNNTLDQDGQNRLQKRLAELDEPRFLQGKTLRVTTTFSFPDTERGRFFNSAMENFVNFGGELTVPGEFIPKLEFPDWWETRYGKKDVEFVTLKSNPGRTPIPVSLSAVGPERAESIDFNLLMLKGGRKGLSLRGDGVDFLSLELALQDEGEYSTLTVKQNFKFPGATVRDTLAVARFFLAWHDAGSAELKFRDGSHSLGTVPLEALAAIPSIEKLLSWEQLLKKLMFIEQKLSHFGRFDLSNGVPDDSLYDIEYLYKFCKGENWKGKTTWSFKLRRDVVVPLRQQSDTESAVVKLGGVKIQLLGVTVVIESLSLHFENPGDLLDAMTKAVTEKTYAGAVAHTVIRHELEQWGEPERNILKSKERKKVSKRKRKG